MPTTAPTHDPLRRGTLAVLTDEGAYCGEHERDGWLTRFYARPHLTDVRTYYKRPGGIAWHEHRPVRVSLTEAQLCAHMDAHQDDEGMLVTLGRCIATMHRLAREEAEAERADLVLAPGEYVITLDGSGLSA